MSANHAPSPPDPLARAEAALRATPIPDGPSPAALARTLAALQDAESKPISPVSRRNLTMLLTTTKVAAAVLAAAGGLLYFSPSRPAAATTFQEVARKLREARSLTYREVVELPGRPAAAMRIAYREPGLYRREMPDGGIIVTDAARGESLVLDPKVRVATRLRDEDARGEAGDGFLSHLEALRDLAPGQGKPVGNREVGGVAVQGWRIGEGPAELTIWFDPAAKVPVEVESRLPFGDKSGRVTMDQITLDPPLDPASFRLDVPAGYREEARSFRAVAPEDAVVMLLRAHAAATGGRFPASLTDPTSYLAALPPAGDERIKLAPSVGVIATFPFTLKDHGYRGGEARLGDADKVIFWHRPQGAAKYRAVFGDLRVEDVDASRLPR